MNHSDQPCSCRSFFPLLPAVLVFLMAASCELRAPAAASAAMPPTLSSSDTLDLPGAIRLALANQPTLRSAEYQSHAANARAGQAFSAILPHLSVSAGATRALARDSLGGFFTGPFNSSYSSSFTLRQRVLDFGVTAGSIRAARRSADVARENARGTENDVVLNVSQDYYGLLRTRRLVDVAEQTLAQRQAHYRQANAFFTVGTKPKFDVTKAEADMTSAELDLLRARNNARLAAVTLARDLGIGSSTNLNVRDIQDTTVITPDLEAGLTEAEARRPDIQASKARVLAAGAQVTSARGGLLPALDAVFNYDFTGNDIPLRKDWSVGLSAGLPIFDGLANVKRVDETRAEESAAEQDLAALRLQVRQEVEQAALNLSVARDNLRVTDRLLTEAQENMAVAEGRYRAGAGSIIEVADAEAQLASASQEDVTARYDLQAARSVWEHALGRPTAR